ncbi:MAG TPA: hypothetical protein VGG46_02230 [Terriglobales bacterium]
MRRKHSTFLIYRDQPMRPKMYTVTKQNDVTFTQAFRTNLLHPQHFPIANCGRHARAKGAKTETLPAVHQLAGKFME